MVDSSPSSWLMEAAVEPWLKRAMLESGTMVLAAALSDWPEEGSRRAGFTGMVLVTAGVATDDVAAVPLALAPLLPLTFLAGM